MKVQDGIWPLPYVMALSLPNIKKLRMIARPPSHVIAYLLKRSTCNEEGLFAMSVNLADILCEGGIDTMSAPRLQGDNRTTIYLCLSLVVITACLALTTLEKWIIASPHQVLSNPKIVRSNYFEQLYPGYPRAIFVGRLTRSFFNFPRTSRP